MAAGVDETVLSEAAPEGLDAIQRVVARYLTFPGARRYTPPDVYAKAGVDEDWATALWRAMGFPEVPDDQKAFTDADVEALDLATRLFERAHLDRAVALQQARTMSQAVSRVAFANQDVIADFTTETDPLRRAEEAIELAKDTLTAPDRSPDKGYRPLRVGVATGDVIPREGDIFGPTVNLANRLVVVARPGTVLVDRATRDALANDARFEVTPIAARHLKGLGRVRPYRLR